MVNISRSVQPEILDGLPQDSRAARASRRDLSVINRLLGSTGWFRRVLRETYRPDENVLEIGAGAGDLASALSSVVANVAGLDLGRRPLKWPAQAQWFETNIFDFSGWAEYPIVIGNLFFHHFDQAGLAALGAHLNKHARVIIASEPLRVHRSQYLFSLLCPLINAHPVTRYDGRVSIAAGFRREELPSLLQLDVADWSWRVQETWRGACRMIAMRRL